MVDTPLYIRAIIRSVARERGGGEADNATNPTDSIELSLTVVPRSSRSRETIRLSPSLSSSSSTSSSSSFPLATRRNGSIPFRFSTGSRVGRRGGVATDIGRSEAVAKPRGGGTRRVLSLPLEEEGVRDLLS